MKEGQRIQYCPYCGTKLFFDDGVKRFEYQDKTHLEEMKYKRKVELEDREENDKYKVESEKVFYKFVAVFFIILIIFAMIAEKFF